MVIPIPMALNDLCYPLCITHSSSVVTLACHPHAPSIPSKMMSSVVFRGGADRATALCLVGPGKIF